MEENLESLISQLEQLTITLKAKGECSELPRLHALIQEATRITNIRPLEASERNVMRAQLKTILPSRFNNYKNGTKQKGHQTRPAATLRVHYRDHVELWLDRLTEKLYKGEGIPCSGISTPASAVNSCPQSNAIYAHNPNFEAFVFDHWLEQEKINQVMLACLTLLCESTSNPKAYKVATIRAHYNESKEGEFHKEVAPFLEKHLKMDLYRDDLFGTNLFLRCPSCNKLSKSTDNHPQPAKDRYLHVKHTPLPINIKRPCPLPEKILKDAGIPT